ncbi:CHASE domain-containing protein [Varunaivibrio sulfuroxidans]|uniref:histidine kinase n=1 Tax=Varunaivibrio sulfuroxidans TaxID=1773489 RepID=A0A4R3JGS1_9PROT|nr:CHASE domain-containing protein [Varunaivibrio sulfuroxidans]TCS65132.1 PAS domain S-box-containing protein [Varunaivibrio sulfuroxidans]WES29582.1 CHASE domain-containing protein [Varunaivibrio sulfuroxidans]
MFKKSPSGKFTVEIAILAATYFGACILGRHFAISPGYVTAVFPASGIALAAILLRGYTLWPGIFLGSFLGNVVLLSRLDINDLHVGLAAVGIAIGATLQALAGGAMIKRYILKPLDLDEAADIFKFLGLGGPLSCLISATVGVIVLHGVGALASGAAIEGWWSWWLGDTFGVLITTPLIFIFMAPPRDIWSKRRTTVALPVAISLFALLMLFIQIRGWESEQIQFNFHDKSLQIATALSESMKIPHETVASLERFYASSGAISPAEFSTFTAYALKNHPSIQALEWVAKVPGAQRASFIRQQRQLRAPNFRITERDPSGRIVPAKIRPVYYPVTYVDPHISNERALGFDLGSNHNRLTALNKARDEGRMIATGRINLIQGNSKTTGLLLLHPLYDMGVTPTSITERRRLLSGFVLGVFRIKDIFNGVLDNHDESDTVLIVKDLSAPKSAELLYGDPTALPDPSSPEASWTIHIPFQVADRHWELNFTPAAGFLEKHRPWQSWLGLNGGLMFVGLFLILLLVLTGHTARTERLVAERTRELSRSEESARAVFDTVLDGVIIIDEAGAIKSANAAALESFGYRPENLAGMSISSLIPEIAHITNVSQLAATYAQGKQHDDDESDGGDYIGAFSEVQALRRDGAAFPIELSIAEMNIEGECLFVGVLRDITERKEVDRIKDEFISTISHELRTPLTSIKGSLGLLSGKTSKISPQKSSELIDLALKNTERLILLVNDILDMEKLASGQMVFDKHPLNFADLVHQGIRENSGFADAYGVTYKPGAIADDLLVRADQSRLQQVIANLLSNAVKFSPRGGVVGITLVRRNNIARLSVSDHGTGIPPEFQPLVFDRFTQADASDTRSGSGTGLGLHISKSIVEKHDGRISFISPPGEGATFFVDLPILEARL